MLAPYTFIGEVGAFFHSKQDELGDRRCGHSMYPSSPPYRPMAPGLARYGSAPSSLQSIVPNSDAGILAQFFPASGSSDRTEQNSSGSQPERSSSSGTAAPASSFSPTALARHSSFPTSDILFHLALDNNELLASVKCKMSSASNLICPAGCNGGYGTGVDVAKRTLKPQRSFSRQESKLGDVSRMGTSWSEESNTIAFSAPPNKRDKDINGDILAALDHIDVELYGALPHKTIEMATLESFLRLQQDAVPCKIRAKRGCATHPRSIAERHRRTRISEKLRKVQELVPNMEKQTSTAEMLDLAVQHIKYLQNEIQKLQRERSNCCCGSKN